MKPDQFHDVEQAVLRFWYALDRRDYGALLNGVTEDCLWLRDRWIQGQWAISAALAQRPASLSIRHLVSNMIFDATHNGVSVQYILTAFSANTPAEASAPLPTSAPTLIADVAMSCALVDGRWLISRIEPAVQFRQANH